MNLPNRLPTADQIGENQKIVIRLDLDLPIVDGQILDNSRLIKSIPTIRLLLDKNCKLIIIGHRGRPERGEDKERLTLRPVYVELMSLLEEGEDSVSSVFVEDILSKEDIYQALEDNQIVFLENLRFWKEETEGKVEFLAHLAEIASVFVNDALAVSHRRSASIMLLKLMPTYYGMGFAREVERMTEILIEPTKPVLLILGGAKEDKLNWLKELSTKVDKILIGGKLPTYREKFADIDNVVWGQLDESGMDINDISIDRFVSEVSMAGTIILAGTMGKFEDIEHRRGSQMITEAICKSSATKMAAGGDTKASLMELGLVDRFDYICSGGGVALEFLARKGKLPAWE